MKTADTIKMLAAIGQAEFSRFSAEDWMAFSGADDPDAQSADVALEGFEGGAKVVVSGSTVEAHGCDIFGAPICLRFEFEQGY